MLWLELSAIAIVPVLLLLLYYISNMVTETSAAWYPPSIVKGLERSSLDEGAAGSRQLS